MSFQHALRGINGPAVDREMLAFLAAYLRSPLSRYYLFHTSSSWGVSRQKVHVEEVLRLPFPLPDQLPNAKRGWQIIREVSSTLMNAAKRADRRFCFTARELFGGQRNHRTACRGVLRYSSHGEDSHRSTDKIIIPSVRPTRARPLVPTIKPSTESQRSAYKEQVCRMLNGWSKRVNLPFAVKRTGPMLSVSGWSCSRRSCEARR